MNCETWSFVSHNIPAGQSNSEMRKIGHKLSHCELEIMITGDNSEIIINDARQHHTLFRSRLDAIQYVKDYLLIETPQGRFTFMRVYKEEENNVSNSN